MLAQSGNGLGTDRSGIKGLIKSYAFILIIMITLYIVILSLVTIALFVIVWRWIWKLIEKKVCSKYILCEKHKTPVMDSRTGLSKGSCPKCTDEGNQWRFGLVESLETSVNTDKKNCT